MVFGILADDVALMSSREPFLRLLAQEPLRTVRLGAILHP
jgi:hypothetical protein